MGSQEPVIARVKMEQATGLQKKGLTIAQFLLRYKRYEGDTGRYIFDSDVDPCSDRKTVIIDECSMLTEDQLAALLNGIKNVSRLLIDEGGREPNMRVPDPVTVCFVILLSLRGMVSLLLKTVMPAVSMIKVSSALVISPGACNTSANWPTRPSTTI